MAPPSVCSPWSCRCVPGREHAVGALVRDAVPRQQVLVVLQTHDPADDPAIRAVFTSYGAPQVAQAFPQLLDASQVRRQAIRTMLAPLPTAREARDARSARGAPHAAAPSLRRAPARAATQCHSRWAAA